MPATASSASMSRIFLLSEGVPLTAGAGRVAPESWRAAGSGLGAGSTRMAAARPAAGSLPRLGRAGVLTSGEACLARGCACSTRGNNAVFSAVRMPSILVLPRWKTREAPASRAAISCSDWPDLSRTNTPMKALLSSSCERICLSTRSAVDLRRRKSSSRASKAIS